MVILFSRILFENTMQTLKKWNIRDTISLRSNNETRSMFWTSVWAAQRRSENKNSVFFFITLLCWQNPRGNMETRFWQHREGGLERGGILDKIMSYCFFLCVINIFIEILRQFVDLAKMKSSFLLLLCVDNILKEAWKQVVVSQQLSLIILSSVFTKS